MSDTATIPMPATKAPKTPKTPKTAVPTLQQAVAGTGAAPLPGTVRVESINVQSDPNTEQFLKACSHLDETMRGQNKGKVRQLAARGANVVEGINVKMLKSLNGDTRDALRSNAIDAMKLVALAAHDPSEVKPRLDEWIQLHFLGQLFPRAMDVEKTSVAVTLCTLITRNAPLVSFTEPEAWSLKLGLTTEAVAAFIDRAVAEKWTDKQVTAGIDTLYGATKPADPKSKTAIDPIGAAKSAATRIVTSIREGGLDAPTFFAEILAELDRYGWTLAEAHDDKGVRTLRAVKATR